MQKILMSFTLAVLVIQFILISLPLKIHLTGLFTLSVMTMAVLSIALRSSSVETTVCVLLPAGMVFE